MGSVPITPFEEGRTITIVHRVSKAPVCGSRFTHDIRGSGRDGSNLTYEPVFVMSKSVTPNGFKAVGCRYDVSDWFISLFWEKAFAVC